MASGGLTEEYPSLNYGLFRGSGSFTYAIASQLMGWATIRFGIPVRFGIGGVFNLLAFLIALTIRDVQRPKAVKKEDSTQLTGEKAVLAPAAMNYLPRSVDERVRSTAVTIYAAVTGSVTSIIGNLITTLLLSVGVSAQSAIAFFGIFSLLGFILAVVAKIRRIW